MLAKSELTPGPHLSGHWAAHGFLWGRPLSQVTFSGWGVGVQASVFPTGLGCVSLPSPSRGRCSTEAQQLSLQNRNSESAPELRACSRVLQEQQGLEGRVQAQARLLA